MVDTAAYPLGTDRTEFERLHFQHRLWADAAHALWKKAGAKPGARVLDLGAGPGAASFDLAQLVTGDGRVVAIDESRSFVEHIEHQARARGFGQLHAIQGDVRALSSLEHATHGKLKEASFDLAYARWVLCFTERPEEVVRGVAKLLKVGGAFCVHDYFNYEFMTPGPRRASYSKMVKAAGQSWRDKGGDPDVVGKLPRLFREGGLELVHLDVHQRVARPGDTMWEWATTWWRSYSPKLIAMGYVTKGEVEEFDRDVASMTREDDFLVMPPVFEVMGRRT